jgi:hypothetical protein
MELVPDGGKLNLHTESPWLATEWEKMKGHAVANYSGGLSWDDMPFPWKRVMEQLRSGQEGKGMEIKLKQEEIPRYQEIVEEYMREVIEKSEAYHPDSTK